MQSMDGSSASVQQGEEPVKEINRDDEQVAQTLRENIGALQTKLKDAEETIRNQNKEIENLKANVDVLVGRVRKLALPIKQAKPESETEATDTEELMESARTKIAGLEAQIREIQQIVRGKESVIEALEQSFSVRIQNLETQLSDKDKLLLDRNKEVNDLECELKTTISRMKEVSSALQQAEALASIQAHDLDIAASLLNREKESLRTPQFTGTAATDSTTVSPDLFDRIARELTRILGPLATVIVHHDVAALGESIEIFPKKRLAELLDIVTKEVGDENLKRAFREHFIKKV